MAFSMADVQNKYGGSAPIALNEYYRGGAYVPDTVGNAGIPTSGAISLSQLQAGSSTSSATTILSHVWNNRSTYFFKGDGSNAWTWSGDLYDRSNSPVNRYVGSYTISGGFTPAGPNYAGVTTLVFFSGGSSAAISSATGSLQADNTGSEMSWQITYVYGLPSTVTSASVTTSRSGGNSGAWSKLLILPGQWAFDSGARVSNMSMGWSRTLAPGRIGWFATGSGYNANMTPPIAGTNANIIRGSEWWYNNSVSYIQFNPSGGNYTFQPGNMTDNYGNPAGIWTYNRRYNELYLVG